MAYIIQISTANQKINENDYAQLIIEFTINLTGTNEYWNAEAHGIKVLDWGNIETRYDFDDLLLVPSTNEILLGDANGELDNLLFGSSAVSQSCDKRAYIRILINGVDDYTGYVQEDSITSNDGDKTIRLVSDPKIEILNKTQLFDDNGNALNPMNFEWYNNRPIKEFIEKTYKLVNPLLSFASGTISFIHNWKFTGFRTSDGLLFSDINTDELKIFGQKLIGVQAKEYGVNSAGDFLRVFARNFCSFTGMTSYGKAFFKKLFYYNPSNIQSVKVLSRKKGYITQTLEYVELTTHIYEDQKTYIEPTGTVNPNITGKALKEDLFTGFIDYSGAPNSSKTQISATISRGNTYDGTYQVQGVADPDINNGQVMDNGALAAKFWYNFKGNINRMRIDEFEFEGINYDFVKDFNYNGSKFQPIEMKKTLGKNKTTCRAIYLGEL